MQLMERTPIKAGRGSAIGRVLQEKTTIHILDAQTDPDYQLVEFRKLGDFRTMLGVPLLREGAPIGVFVLMRRTVRPFTDKQIELATTFSDQAVIAIENVRLFDDIQEKSRQRITASGKKRTDYLFHGRGVEGRHPMGQRQLNRLLKLWVVEAGLHPSDYSVELLRRTKALHILKGTGDLQTVRALLGHARIESTARYLGLKTKADPIEVCRAFDI